MLDDVVVTPLAMIGKLAELIKIGKSESLLDYTRMTRVEPLVLLDDQVPHYPFIEDVLKSLLSIFAASYLQGVAVSVNVGKINTMRLLDKLSPTRRPMESFAFATESLMRKENYKYGLPKFDIALEAGFAMPKVDSTITSIDQTVTEPEAEPDKPNNLKLGKETLTVVQSAANLSVGMVLDVEIESDGSKANIPITVRLITNVVPDAIFVHIFTHNAKKIDFKERYHGWRSGELEFINDIVLCQDLISAHRKALIKDKTGIYREIMSRRTQNRFSGIVSMNPSVATASNMAVISTATAAAIESEVGGRLDNYAIRERIFKDTYMMIIVVLDAQYEQVTMYYRGIQTPTQVSVKGMKHAGKGNGMDVAEVLRSFQLGTAPRF